jgi:hypothetical protein
MLFVVLATLAGCSVQQERSGEQETKRGEQKEEKQQAHFQQLDIAQVQA